MDHSTVFDVLIIGGGINGTGIARDASGRGLSVLLCEQNDLASHTSSASTKLIHGGLRYLEYKEFSLVHKALKEREVLMRSAPHIIHPLRFVMPHMPHLRPAWLIRLGLFLYDHLAKRQFLPASKQIAMHQHPTGQPLVDTIKQGFLYSDGWVDDARLVTLNALDAKEHQATILTRTRLVSAHVENHLWVAELITENGEKQTVKSKTLINATGPWVSDVLKQIVHFKAHHQITLVKGSHIVTPRLFDHNYAYLFQNPDKRIIFAIPYEQNYTLIGTTDVPYHGNPDKVQIDEEEIAYLCTSINRYFKKQIQAKEICWHYSGVRPLFADEHQDNPSAVTRDYKIEQDRIENALCISVFGGKITTYRKLAEEVTDLICQTLQAQKAWTANSYLPGGDLPENNLALYIQMLEQRFPWLDKTLIQRLANAYGTRTMTLLGHATQIEDLGICFFGNFYEAELRYLKQYEWVQTAEDVLWRRSKLGLSLPAPEQERVIHQLNTWLHANSL